MGKVIPPLGKATALWGPPPSSAWAAWTASVASAKSCIPGKRAPWATRVGETMKIGLRWSVCVAIRMKNAASAAIRGTSARRSELTASVPRRRNIRRVQVGFIGQGGGFSPPMPAWQRVRQMITPFGLAAQAVLGMHLNDCHKSKSRGWALVISTSAGSGTITPHEVEQCLLSIC